MRSFVVLLAAACCGCAAGETVRFQPKAQQEAIVRDGNQALVSRRNQSLVMIGPASREFASGARPVFVVGLYNLSNVPIQFRVANIQAAQIVNQQAAALKVITYEDLLQEEKNRQVAMAILTGIAVGANAAAASTAGHGTYSSTTYAPRGTYQTTGTYYSPTAAAVAQSNASAQNEALIAATVQRGQQNMAMLERGVIKDNTMLPGEWYGGQLHLQPLISDGSSAAKTYSIAILVGADRHEIEIVQGRPR